ncbi:MAG: hypothetical protein HY294_12200 [Candidatus Rokubacteria bacterium]|nr:hypothetical protein [Candidatus Rokubacteria bacterium]
MDTIALREARPDELDAIGEMMLAAYQEFMPPERPHEWLSYLLMEMFYDQLRTKEPAQALREAQREAARQFPPSLRLGRVRSDGDPALIARVASAGHRSTEELVQAGHCHRDRGAGRVGPRGAGAAPRQ